MSPTIITTCVISFFAAEREKGEEEEVCMVVCCCMVWYDTIVHNNNNPLHTQEVEKREGFVRLFDNKRKRENSHHDDEEKRTRREDRGEEEEKRERRKKKREENEFTDVSVPNGQKSKKRDSRFQIPSTPSRVVHHHSKVFESKLHPTPKKFFPPSCLLSLICSLSCC